MIKNEHHTELIPLEGIIKWLNFRLEKAAKEKQMICEDKNIVISENIKLYKRVDYLERQNECLREALAASTGEGTVQSERLIGTKMQYRAQIKELENIIRVQKKDIDRLIYELNREKGLI